MNHLIVTRHKALVALLLERDLVPASCEVVEHATPENVRGKHVFGVLPFELAALADRITVIPLALAAEDRGKELDIARMRAIAGEAVTYQVSQVGLPIPRKEVT
jgi:hypothetical protein